MARKRSIPRKGIPYLAASLVFALAVLALAFLEFFPWLAQFDRSYYDFIFRIRAPRTAPTEIVIVSIDETSIQELGPYPWDRRVHALLLRKLKEAGARLAVFDVLFDRTTEAEKDAALAGAIENFGNVILGREISKTSDPLYQLEVTLDPAPIFLKAGAHLGFVSTPADPDTKIRKSYWLVQGEPTLATSALSLLSGQAVKIEGHDLCVGDSRMPVEVQGNPPAYLINFVGPAHTIPTRSYYQVLDGTIPPGFLKDKIVFVGADLAAENSAGGAAVDRFPTPVDTDVLMPGVEIHANALNTLLTRSFIRTPSAGTNWLISLAVAVLVTLFCLLLRPLAAGLATFATLVGLLGGGYYLLSHHNDWLPPAHPLALLAFVYGGNTLIQYRAALKERTQIRNAFRHYVSVEVLGELMKNPASLELGGRELEATVLFTDIAGFSKISERITPQELTQLLNQYFELLATVIMKEGGMVNKFIGDAIMAVWGVPLDNPRHAIDACRASLQMQRSLRVMEPLRCRIGLNTGTMIAGNLGSRQRFEYTVIGDAVNLASRLEGANKPYHTDIMISEFTEEKVRGHFLVREVDRIRVVGKENPVRIYQLLDSLDNRGTSEYESLTAMVDSFTNSLEEYRKQQWGAAASYFEKHQEHFPGDPLASIYLERCRSFVAQPPVQDWDGVYQMETK